MEGTREAEMIVSFALQGINYILRLSGTAAKNIAVMLAALSKMPDKSAGVTRMKALLQSGEPLDYYTVPADKMKEFAKMAKGYGIQYCVALNQDGAYDLVVKKSDSSRLNRVAEQLGIGQIQGTVGMDLSDEEKANAVNITPEQKIMQDMMSPNKDEREMEENPYHEEFLEEHQSGNSSVSNHESVLEQIEQYKNESESARDMFASARNLREAAMSDLPDGMEPVAAEIGWDRPVTRYNEAGEQLFRGKTADQMTDTDKMQYMVDQEMLSNGRLSEGFIRNLYLSGYKVDESGIVTKNDTQLTSDERKMIADMMRDPDRGREKSIEGTLADGIKEVISHEHGQKLGRADG